MDQSLTVTTLQQALTKGAPEIHHSDQGAQYAVTIYVQMLQAVNVQSVWLKWIKPGTTATLSG